MELPQSHQKDGRHGIVPFQFGPDILKPYPHFPHVIFREKNTTLILWVIKAPSKHVFFFQKNNPNFVGPWSSKQAHDKPGSVCSLGSFDLLVVQTPEIYKDPDLICL